jgi:hypothetical protein
MAWFAMVITPALRPELRLSNHLCALARFAISLPSGPLARSDPGAFTISRTAIPRRLSSAGTEMDICSTSLSATVPIGQTADSRSPSTIDATPTSTRATTHRAGADMQTEHRVGGVNRQVTGRAM